MWLTRVPVRSLPTEMERSIRPQQAIENGRTAFRTTLTLAGDGRPEREVPVFVIRFRDQLHAWVNICPHQGTQLDWEPGEVFDEAGTSLVCASHGALFDPASGLCTAGPCRGASLQAIAVRDSQDGIVLSLPR